MIINSILKDLGTSDERNCGQVPLPESQYNSIGKGHLRGASPSRLNILAENDKNKEKQRGLRPRVPESQ